ncbi:MAG: hypothetical protein Fur0025_19360 [Oscillatoriaceae cyanobacterium]
MPEYQTPRHNPSREQGPFIQRTIAFFDGQNLFHRAKEAFGYNYPNYEPVKLAKKICSQQGWELKETRFYTGVPKQEDDSYLNHFWNTKLAHYCRLYGKNAFWKFTRPLQDGREKGIDVRIALDLVRLARENKYDVGLIFSQDQDLSEAVKDVNDFEKKQRWLRLACAYPENPDFPAPIHGTHLSIPISKEMYDDCIDTRDYWPKSNR